MAMKIIAIPSPVYVPVAFVGIAEVFVFQDDSLLLLGTMMVMMCPSPVSPVSSEASEAFFR
jgi:hypothetical protein